MAYLVIVDRGYRGSVEAQFFDALYGVQMLGDQLGGKDVVLRGTKVPAALADPGDANADGISGRMQTVTDPETSQQRLGRFGNKAGKARVSHQVASALNTDMGVRTPIFPVLDGEITGGTPEISAANLDLVRVGVHERRRIARQRRRGTSRFRFRQSGQR